MNVRCLAMVHNTTHHCTEADFRYGSKGEIGPRGNEVCFTLKNGHQLWRLLRLLCATSGLLQRNKAKGDYSITSSARPSNESGNVMPSALAVLRLMTSSTFVACTTGKSAGLSPLRTRPV